ncbi:MAG TPA: MarR family transcriptional regulator [Thermoleophilia bacterium]|nr:MarR family transcriptional regulator [Thermoleophilia bacterium]
MARRDPIRRAATAARPPGADEPTASTRDGALTCSRFPQPSSVTDEAAPTTHALWRVIRMDKTMMSGRLRALGLALGQDLLLLQLWDHDGCTQSELVGRLGLDPSTITKMLQRMERDGWLTRARSDDDGRASIVTLTPAGRDLRGRVTALWRELESETVKTLSADERGELLRLLGKVEAGLQTTSE